MKIVVRYLISIMTLSALACSPSAPPEAIDVRDADALVSQGTLLLRHEKLEEAEAAFRVALDLYDSPAAVDGLGCVAMLRGDAARAQALFIRAYEMDESYTNSLGNLALLYELLGFTDEAKLLYQRALLENPRNYRFRNNFAAFLHDKVMRTELSREEFRKAQALVKHEIIEDNLDTLERNNGRN